jgi:beta-glucosidase
VYGETPYAEFQGDRETLEFSQPDAAHLETLLRLHVANIPVVSLFISGRPLWVNRELNLSDAFVAAWLPGSEGNGVADMLFKSLPGKPSYDFTGRLSFSWPATAMPVTFDAGDEVHGALFPRGFGLTIAQSQNRAPDLAQLPEHPKIPAIQHEKDTLFHAGHVTAPWSIYVADPIAEVRLTLQSQTTPSGAITAQLSSQAVQARWSGGNKGEFRIGGRAVSLPTAASGGEALRLHYRVEVQPTQPVVLSMRRDPPAGATEGIDLAASFRSANKDSWATLTIPLACLVPAKNATDPVGAPFVLVSSGEFAVSFDDIRLVHEPTVSACPGGHVFQ